MKFLVFDTETNGLPDKDPLKNYTEVEKWPRIAQMAWALYDNENLITFENFFIKPDGWTIPETVTKINGITTEQAILNGITLKEAGNKFYLDVLKADYIVCHNAEFDRNVFAAEIYRMGNKKVAENFIRKPNICTMNGSVGYCSIEKDGVNKRPKLSELHIKLFGESFLGEHDASFDVAATAKCFFELLKKEVIRC